MPTLFTNGHIRTLGPSGVVRQLLSDDQGTIVSVGNNATELARLMGARTVNLGGKTVLPGPVDAHVHLLWHAENDLLQADLLGSTSVDEVLERLNQHKSRRPDGWLRGHGFDHEMFPTRAFPTRKELDSVSSDRPILISRICGHAVVANSRALELAGVVSDSGVLTEERMDPVYAQIPDTTLDEWIEYARHGVQLALRAGFTGVHVLVRTAEEIAAFQTLRKNGELPVRVRLQYPYSLLGALKAAGQRTGFGDEWLSVGAIKIFSDGSMGARTAALTTDYADEAGNTGELIYPQESLEEMVREVHEADCQVCIHAIGDRAMDCTMDAIVKAAGPATRAARHRIEHSSITRPDQIQGLAETGIVSCVQPQFIVTDFWTSLRLGEERKGWIYPFASMRKAGALLSGGTDCPVERLDALEAIGRAVTRDAPWRGEEISQGYVESECLTVEEAWDIFTSGSAYSGFAEHRFGKLEPGMACDFIALDRDPFTADAREIETMSPAMTVTGGHVRYEAQTGE